jgi:GGDEF domain-containing protein
MNKVGGKARIYRYGGEEFTVLFKGKYADQAVEYLEELRESIANYDMTIRNKQTRPKNNRTGSRKRNKSTASNTVNVTVSVGVADSYETRKAEHVRKEADEALYRAKNAGRNCVSA